MYIKGVRLNPCDHWKSQTSFLLLEFVYIALQMYQANSKNNHNAQGKIQTFDEGITDGYLDIGTSVLTLITWSSHVFS